MSLFEARIEIARSCVEVIDELLLEREAGAWSVIEDVIDGRAWIVGVFPDADQARESTKEMISWLPPQSEQRELELRELPEAEWRDSYKAHFRAWQFGRLHWVPKWERDAFRLPEGDAVLWLDPGLAFGTGNHETTRLCVERLVEFAAERGTTGRIIDAGCGSGILALSAAKLGFAEVEGFDNDPEAVRVSEENAELNELGGRVRFFVGDLVTGLHRHQADVVMANILADVLIRYARELTAAVSPGGRLILSGILAAECEQVRDAFARAAPEWTQHSRTMGEWSDVVLDRPAKPRA